MLYMYTVYGVKKFKQHCNNNPNDLFYGAHHEDMSIPIHALLGGCLLHLVPGKNLGTPAKGLNMRLGWYTVHERVDMGTGVVQSIQYSIIG